MVSLTYRKVLSEYIDNLYNENFDSQEVIPLIEEAINELGNFDINEIANLILDDLSSYHHIDFIYEEMDRILWDTLEEYERKVSPQTIVEDLYKRYGEKIFDEFKFYYDKEINSKYQLDTILQETNYDYVLNVFYDYLFEENNIHDEAFEEILFKELEKY